MVAKYLRLPNFRYCQAACSKKYGLEVGDFGGFLGGTVVGTTAPTAPELGSIPGVGTTILQAALPKKKVEDFMFLIRVN